MENRTAFRGKTAVDDKIDDNMIEQLTKAIFSLGFNTPLHIVGPTSLWY